MLNRMEGIGQPCLSGTLVALTSSSGLHQSVFFLCSAVGSADGAS